MENSQIVRTKNGFTWDTTGNKARLDWILNPIIRSAADVLVSDELKNIKSCADPAPAGGFFWISAATSVVAGVICRIAEIAPRPVGSIRKNNAGFEPTVIVRLQP